MSVFISYFVNLHILNEYHDFFDDSFTFYSTKVFFLEIFFRLSCFLFFLIILYLDKNILNQLLKTKFSANPANFRIKELESFKASAL